MPTLESLITNDQISLLKQGYDDALIYQLAIDSLAGPFPEAESWLNGSGGYFFGTDKNMGPSHRELCALSILTSMRASEELVIHVYWGLMVGLSVNQIADAIFLGGHFSGVAAYNGALKVAKVALANLAAQAEAGRADPKNLLSVRKVVPALAVGYARAAAGLPPA